MNFKIITWNVNSINTRLDHLLELIDKHNPDIICLQEIKCEMSRFPTTALEHLPYNIYGHGQKSYNGVAILAKVPASEVKTSFTANPLPNDCRFIECAFNTTIGYIRVISLYAPNGNTVASEKFLLKLDFYQAFSRYVHSISTFDEQLFLGGDYNIAPYDIDVYSPEKMRHSICFTHAEKMQLRTMLNSNLVDNFRAIYPHKQDFSWFDYRGGAFEHNYGLRIDSILSTSNAVANLADCFIDYDMRRKIKPSDHAPVIALYTIPKSKGL